MVPGTLGKQRAVVARCFAHVKTRNDAAALCVHVFGDKDVIDRHAAVKRGCETVTDRRPFSWREILDFKRITRGREKRDRCRNTGRIEIAGEDEKFTPPAFQQLIAQYQGLPCTHRRKDMIQMCIGKGEYRSICAILQNADGSDAGINGSGIEGTALIRCIREPEGAAGQNVEAILLEQDAAAFVGIEIFIAARLSIELIGIEGVGQKGDHVIRQLLDPDEIRVIPADQFLNGTDTVLKSHRSDIEGTGVLEIETHDGIVGHIPIL